LKQSLLLFIQASILLKLLFAGSCTTLRIIIWLIAEKRAAEYWLILLYLNDWETPDSDLQNAPRVTKNNIHVHYVIRFTDLFSSWKFRNTILANLSKTNDLTILGTRIPRTPRWCKFNVTTARPDANDTRQMLTP